MKLSFKLQGPEIKKLRLQADRSQQHLAKEVGVSQSKISRWEAGEFSDMSDKEAILLCRALKIDLRSVLQEQIYHFCPNFSCPMSFWERSGGELHAIPHLKKWPQELACYCGYCREQLMGFHCPNCEAPVTPGQSMCSSCGRPYCPSSTSIPKEDETQHNQKREQILALKAQLEQSS